MGKTLLFFLISVFGYGQQYPSQFVKLDSVQFYNTVKQLTLDTGKNYVLDQEGSNNGKSLRFVNTDREKDPFQVNYFVTMEGENKALEIKGTKKFTINSIYGRFLTLFPIWKKYIVANAEPEAMSIRSTTLYIGQRTVQFIKGDESSPWIIRF